MTSQPDQPQEDKLREKLEPFPPEFQAQVLAYRRAPSPNGLEAIVRGILDYHGGEIFREQHALKQDGVRLVEDLGFDSLALVDLSFQAEEFIGVVIQLEDFPKIKTLGELQAFLRAKAFPAAGAAG
jgi:acyl carrier protein